MKKILIILACLAFTPGLIYSVWCVRENYKTGEWSQSCGFIFTNPHYRTCVQTRTWVPTPPPGFIPVVSQTVPALAPTIDYDTLAKQAGAIASVPAPTKPLITIYGGETLSIGHPPSTVKSGPRTPLIYLGHKQKFAFVCGVPGEQSFRVPNSTESSADLSCP